MTAFQERIQGSVPALLTPLKEDFAVDTGAMRRSARRLLDNGCQGLVVVGTSGEFAGIDEGQRELAIQAVVEEAAGQVPVLVGCGQPNVQRTHREAHSAADLGADGLLVNPPFYFPMTQDEVVRFFADLVGAASLSVLLYNIPGMTGVAVEPATIPRLRDVGVQGVKDSSGSPANTLAYLAALDGDSDFRVVVGGESFFLQLLDAGVCATTGLLANIVPQLTVAIHRAWLEGDYPAAFAAQRRANEFAAAFRPLNSFFHATGKAVLSRLELMEKWVAPPKTPLTDAEADGAFATLKEFLPEFDQT
ncbi:MAG: hypothetical protein GKR89_14590 [Candidatus Latescibacteria bacterium]|nr:hypothetical protein [Candidatus Latescibacterota bacterium]